MFLKDTSVLTLATLGVRRAEEYTVIIKLGNTEYGGLPIYTTSSSGRL